MVARALRKDKVPPQWVGLKFFNVFGPNEFHKSEMMSLVAKRFDDAKAGRPIRLFKSHRAGVADGEQKRDDRGERAEVVGHSEPEPHRRIALAARFHFPADRRLHQLIETGPIGTRALRTV